MTARIVDPASLSAVPVAVLPQGACIDVYDIECVISHSAFAVVYRAVDPAVGQVVAVKEYLPAMLAHRNTRLRVVPRSIDCSERFERGRQVFVEEAEALQHVDHPSLVRVLGVVHDHGTACRVMRFAPGPTLLEHRRALGRLPAAEDVGRWFEGLLGALAALHACGRLHGAVRPGNILLRPGERPLLLGFGAVRRALGDDGTRGDASSQEPWARPVERMQPTARHAVGPWTDLYDLAASLHYGLSGRLPDPCGRDRGAVGREPFAEVWRQAADGAAPPEDLVPLCVALDACLAAEPSDRPQSVAELRRRLGHAAAAGWTAGTDMGPAAQAATPTFAPDAPTSAVADPTTWPASVAAEPQVWQLELALEPDLQLALTLEPESSANTADTAGTADTADTADTAVASSGTAALATAPAGVTTPYEVMAGTDAATRLPSGLAPPREATALRSPPGSGTRVAASPGGEPTEVARPAPVETRKTGFEAEAVAETETGRGIEVEMAAGSGTEPQPAPAPVLLRPAPVTLSPAAAPPLPPRPTVHAHRRRRPSNRGPTRVAAWVSARQASWRRAAVPAGSALLLIVVAGDWWAGRMEDAPVVAQSRSTAPPPLVFEPPGAGRAGEGAQRAGAGAGPAAGEPWDGLWALPVPPWTGMPALQPQAAVQAAMTAEAPRAAQPPQRSRPPIASNPPHALPEPRDLQTAAPPRPALATTPGPVPVSGRTTTATPSAAPPQRVARQPAAKAPTPPVAGQATPAAPREDCRGRAGFALYQCMQLACAKPAWSAHAQCVRLRHSDGVR